MDYNPIHADRILNPNEKIVQSITKALKVNNNYCPCNSLKTIEQICPCSNYRQNKICHCSLYISKDKVYD